LQEEQPEEQPHKLHKTSHNLRVANAEPPTPLATAFLPLRGVVNISYALSRTEQKLANNLQNFMRQRKIIAGSCLVKQLQWQVAGCWLQVAVAGSHLVITQNDNEIYKNKTWNGC